MKPKSVSSGAKNGAGESMAAMVLAGSDVACHMALVHK